MDKRNNNGMWALKDWPMSLKISSIVVLMIILLITLIILISRWNIRSSISEQVGNEFEITTNGINQALSEYIVIYIDQIGTLTLNEGIQSSILTANSKYGSNDRINLDEIQEVDKQWVQGDRSELSEEKYTTYDYDVNMASHEILHFAENYPEHKEILLTDKYGALVASSAKTSDYYQGDEEWWKVAWNNGRGGFYFSSPEFDESIGEVVLMIAFPVYSDQDRPIGVVRTNIQANNMLKFMEGNSLGETGRAFIVNRKGDYLIRKNQSDSFENLVFTDPQNIETMGHGITNNENKVEVIYGFKKFDVGFVTNIQDHIQQSFINTVSNLDWFIVYSQQTSEAFSVINIVSESILLVGLILLAIFIVITALVINRLIKPLKRIIVKGEQVIEGDFNVEITSNSNDEIGKLSKMFNNLVVSLKEMASTATKISEGDLRVNIEPRSDKDEMGKAFKQMTVFLKEQINEISKAVSTLTSSNSQLMATVAEVSSSSSETVTTVSEVSTTIEEVKQTAEVSTQKAKNVAETANKSVQISEKGIRSTEDAVDGMNLIQNQVKKIADTIIKLSEQSQTIGEITSAVNDLAEQSNLLAVNASIEAVKAGEYGKGFGVVAQEIRALADQSKQATRQIRDILNDVQKAISSAVMATEEGGKAVEKGVTLAEVSGDAISMLADSISEAAQAASQIAASSQQQLTGMEQLAVAMDNIKQATQQNETGNKETEKAVESLKTLVETLKIITAKYKLD